jgi:putative transposase
MMRGCCSKPTRRFGRFASGRHTWTAKRGGCLISGWTRADIPGFGRCPQRRALPETAYSCWRQIRFDHARAHLAADSLNVACELLGCTVDVGPAYQPDERPFIERFFGTVATRFSHRLPGTTDSDPDDILRKLKDPHGDLRLVVSLEELRELLAVWVWNYNGTPHGGLGSAGTPLEAMTAAIRGRRTLLRHLPLSLRGSLCLLQSVVERMKRYGFYFVDPRLVSIEFRGGGKLARRRFADN